LLPVVSALARWGSRWAWCEPRPGEAIDVGAILRSLPGIELPADLKGIVELTVAGERSSGSYAIAAADGRMTVREHPAADPPQAAARISGEQHDWIAALSPNGDDATLKISGDTGLARRFLNVIAPKAVQHAAIA
jgi:hypothetical protein